MDFTLKTYKSLLNALIEQGFLFQTFQEYLDKGSPLGEKGVSVGRDHQKIIILRPACTIAPASKHDVDKLA